MRPGKTHQQLVWLLFSLPLTALSAQADEPVNLGRSEYVGRLTPSADHAALLDDLVEDGFNRRISTDEMKHHFAQALLESRNDPAVRYALALALARRNDYDEALDVLKQARGSDDEPYAPAWKASIWILMNRHRYEEGFDLLEKFAALQNRDGVKWPSPAAPLQNCRWIGRLLSGLDLDLIGVRERALHLDCYVDIEESFRPENRGAMHIGVRDTLTTYRKLNDSLAVLRENAKKQEAEQRIAVTKELAGKQGDLAQQKEKIKLTADEWKKKFDDALIELSKKIGSTQRDYNLLEAKRQSLDRSIAALEQRISTLGGLYSFAPNKNLSNRGGIVGGAFIGGSGVETRAKATLLSDIAARQQQLAGYQAQYNQTVDQLNVTRNAGLILLHQRANLIAEYQKATGNLVKQDKSLDALSKKFSRDVKKLNDGPPEGKNRETRTVQRQMKQFQTYVPFSLETERTRLVDAHTPVPEPAQE